MIQPFCSVYTKSYRTHEREPETERTKPCLYYQDLVENFLPLEDSKDIYNPERDETVIKNMYLKRLETIYQATYCASVGKKSLVIDPNNLDEDQFMVYFNDAYKKKTQAVPRPLDTARRVNGYTRFERYYTGMSHYRDVICREAYNYFKRDYDKGKSRLYAKKQQALRGATQQEEPEPKPKEDPAEEPGPRQRPEPKGTPVPEKICALCCEKFGDFSSRDSPGNRGT